MKYSQHTAPQESQVRTRCAQQRKQEQKSKYYYDLVSVEETDGKTHDMVEG